MLPDTTDIFDDKWRSYTSVYLNEARIIARTGFVSHLDLELTQLPPKVKRPNLSFSLFKKLFFCGFETNRYYFTPSGRLKRLSYNLNLDFPADTKFSLLGNGYDSLDLLSDVPSFLVAFEVSNSFFKDAQVKLLEIVCEKQGNKLKLLKWMVDFRPLEITDIPKRVQYIFARILYRECEDPELSSKFFLKFIELDLFSNRCCRDESKLDVLQHLLYQARLSDFYVSSKMEYGLSLTDQCIRYDTFDLIPSILQSEGTAAYYTQVSYEAIKRYIHLKWRLWLKLEDLSKPESQMSHLRIYRMLQLVAVYYLKNETSDLEDVFKAIRFIWSSIPDSFLSLQEMMDAYEHLFSVEDIRKMHHFYERAIGQIILCREPRLLSQYCRVVVRKSLVNSKQCLPAGIKQLKVPSRYHSYLNLERDNLYPDFPEA